MPVAPLRVLVACACLVAARAALGAVSTYLSGLANTPRGFVKGDGVWYMGFQGFQTTVQIVNASTKTVTLLAGSDSGRYTTQPLAPTPRLVPAAAWGCA